MILTTKLCELKALAMELYPWFDVDKVKSYAVYVWYRPTKEDLKHPNYPGDEFGWNVFDIYADHLQFYRCDWPWRLPNEAIPIIKKIQDKLMEMENYIGGLTNESKSNRCHDRSSFRTLNGIIIRIPRSKWAILFMRMRLRKPENCRHE